MPTIRPYRNINEHDILTNFAWNPTGAYPTVKGTLVKIVSGLMQDQNLQQLGDVGAHFQNIVSQRYGLQPYVAAVTSSGDLPIGLTLYDVRETDENGERLIYHPEKAAKMQAVVSGQAVPIATQGIFIYSGVEGALPTAAGPAFCGINGGITASGLVSNALITRVGTFLGPADSKGFVYLKLNCI